MVARRLRSIERVDPLGTVRHCFDTQVRRRGYGAHVVVQRRRRRATGYGQRAESGPPVRPIETDLPPITVDFRDIAAGAGLTAANVSGGQDAKKYILETTGSGVAIFDFDNDGLMDVYLANATTLDGEGPGKTATGHLYRNRGGLRFDDVTERAGLTRTGWGQGVCVGDYDNDGRRDLFVAYYGQS